MLGEVKLSDKEAVRQTINYLQTVLQCLIEKEQATCQHNYILDFTPTYYGGQCYTCAICDKRSNHYR